MFRPIDFDNGDKKNYSDGLRPLSDLVAEIRGL